MADQPQIVSDGNGSGYFAENRAEIQNLRKRLPKGIRGSCMSIMRFLISGAAHAQNIVEGTPLERGEVYVTRMELQMETGLSEKQVRTALYALEGDLKEVSQIRAKLGPNGGSILSVVNYDSYDAFSQNRLSPGQNEGRQGPDAIIEHARRFKEVKEVKEVDSKALSADADGQTPATPSLPPSPEIPVGQVPGVPEAEPPTTPPPVPKKRRASKAPTPKPPPVDPMLNCNIFIDRAAEEGLVPSRLRDGKIIKDLLAQRRAQGVEDTQAELWTLWEKFQGVPTDADSPVFQMRGRAHDIPAFRTMFQWLLEQGSANGNGKAHPPHPQAACPEHGWPSMRRENWGSRVVFKCQSCDFAYKTEALWTDQPQQWEKTLMAQRP